MMAVVTLGCKNVDLVERGIVPEEDWLNWTILFDGSMKLSNIIKTYVQQKPTVVQNKYYQF